MSAARPTEGTPVGAVLPPTAWTTGTTEVFKTGSWRAALPQHLKRPSPCHQACPVNGEIAQWIGHARADDFRRAWDVLTINNPFPAIAGRICHHPCETACNRAAYDEAVSVCALERAVGDEAIAQGWAYERPAQEREGHVAVVGGGPSGLSAAYQLRRRGWQVTLYEGKPMLGGLMRYGIPSYRLARDVLDAEIQRIVDLGVTVRFGAALANAEDFERLRAMHDAVYVATGAARPKPLPQIPHGAPWLLQGADYLAACSVGAAPAMGQRVVVIGGGSAAMDVARSARRAGCDVTILALEPRAQMPAQREELEEALEEGIQLADGAMLGEVAGNGKGLTLRCRRVNFQPGDAPGRFSVTPIEGSEFTLAADGVLTAIGQDPELTPFAALPARGALLAAGTGQAVASGVWAGGDVASMARFVTEAVGMGKRAAIDIDRELRGEARAEAAATAATPLGELATWYHPHAKRPVRTRLAPGARVQSGSEVQQALTRAQVRAEVQRCFSCGTCTACDNCFQFCPDLAVQRLDGGGYTVLADYCKGCGLCVKECPTGSMLLTEERR